MANAHAEAAPHDTLKWAGSETRGAALGTEEPLEQKQSNYLRNPASVECRSPSAADRRSLLPGTYCWGHSRWKERLGGGGRRKEKYRSDFFLSISLTRCILHFPVYQKQTVQFKVKGGGDGAMPRSLTSVHTPPLWLRATTISQSSLFSGLSASL